MTIFDVLNSLLFTKKQLDLNVEDEQVFNLFMVNRWCSMYSKELATIINHTTNINTTGIFDSKQDQYLFLKNLLPSFRFKRINYIKKTKNKNTDPEVDVKLFANNKQTSQRELKQYIELLNNLSK